MDAGCISHRRWKQGKEPLLLREEIFLVCQVPDKAQEISNLSKHWKKGDHVCHMLESGKSDEKPNDRLGSFLPV
jgi:hypothetical protein